MVRGGGQWQLQTQGQDNKWSGREDSGSFRHRDRITNGQGGGGQWQEISSICSAIKWICLEPIPAVLIYTKCQVYFPPKDLFCNVMDSSYGLAVHSTHRKLRPDSGDLGAFSASGVLFRNLDSSKLLCTGTCSDFCMSNLWTFSDSWFQLLSAYICILKTLHFSNLLHKKVLISVIWCCFS